MALRTEIFATPSLTRLTGNSNGPRSLTNERRSWGISTGPWLWAVRLRILFVIDAHINLSMRREEFGLGQVLDTLRDTSFAWWVRFEVDVAHRDGEQGTMEIRDHRHDPMIVWKRYFGFRFTQSGFDLDSYDQVWFFGYHPGEREDKDIGDFSALESDELKVLAAWMDRGGGAFATGDHGILGASMCSAIPRVRTMRKWKHADGVPDGYDETRHETLRQVPNTSEFAKESDRWPQPIEPVFRNLATSAAFPFTAIAGVPTLAPHPLLCAPEGIIDMLPDHMHEGEVVEDADVELDRPLDIPGYTRPEYPPAIQTVALAGATGATSARPAALHRPRPEVIAHAWTTNPGQDSKRFPVISVYDGVGAGIGRVVVDSTWHHWFSYNLVGFQEDNPHVYARMQAFYRNVAVWLATPAQRAAMLYAATWGALTGLSPMAFHRAMNAWEVGERVVDVIGRTASQCILSEMVAGFLTRDGADLFRVPHGVPRGEPCWSCLPRELMDRAVVGGIGAGLIDLALDYKEQWALKQRPLLDPDAIRQKATAGAEDGLRLLTVSLERASTDLAALRDQLTDQSQPLPVETIPIPIETARVRIVAERLQLPDASDPVLLDDQLSLTLRVRLDEAVIATHTIEQLGIPPFGVHGALIDLRQDLAWATVQTGQILSIEVLVGAWRFDEMGPEVMRFREELTGDPSGWLGRHAPGRAQPWRLWYRIDPIDAASTGTPGLT
jgi:hypothetical protein